MSIWASIEPFEQLSICLCICVRLSIHLVSLTSLQITSLHDRSIDRPIDHSGTNVESIQIRYSPALVSRAQLMEVFWNTHDPTDATKRRKYSSVIWHSNKQQQLTAKAEIAQQQKKISARGNGTTTATGAGARKSKSKLKSKANGVVRTTTEKLKKFFVAPEKHQK